MKTDVAQGGQPYYNAQSADDVRSVITDAGRQGQRLAIQGGGTKHGYGHPFAYDAYLDVSGMRGVVFYEPDELVIKVQAGTSLSEIEQTLAAHKQHLSFEPPSYGALYGVKDRHATIGGTIACNLAGPRRIHASAPRDSLLGIEGVNGLGESFKAGGRTVKNVTGYDIPKVMAGSLGTLAVLTTVTLKVLPAPVLSATFVLEGLSDEVAVNLMLALLRGPVDLSAAAHRPATVNDASKTMFRLEGPARSVKARLADLTAYIHPYGDGTTLYDDECRALWCQVRELDMLGITDDECVWRIVVPATEAPRLVAALNARALYDWGGSQVFLAMPASQVETDASLILQLAHQAGGVATLLRAPDPLRRSIALTPPRNAALRALNERVRDQFDPYVILNPGRLFAVPRTGN